MYVGYVGLAITQSTALVGLIQHGMKTWSELDAQMTSVERVLEYSELAPEEDHGELVPPESWPDRGQISFQSVSMSYSSHSPVLKQVTVEIRGGEKVGVVGRTGAGKTSLISAIFRLFRFEGTILVDDVDTKSVPLAVLRSKISIIPQDPVLFLGSLRKNLDPFDSFTDGELWNALEEVQMKDVVSDWSGGLETLILEGGANVSVGQRQLVCLARAVLRRAKVIVLDEATANVDLKTDQLIQGVIRDKFKECTMLTIAHRLNTVMDSDKILVMDAGRVAEFGSPEELLENPEGHFFRYVSLNSKAKNK
jgi:ATP-binding cassette subfamily C (CFTR/MRP) protein 4